MFSGTHAIALYTYWKLLIEKCAHARMPHIPVQPFLVSHCVYTAAAAVIYTRCTKSVDGCENNRYYVPWRRLLKLSHKSSHQMCKLYMHVFFFLFFVLINAFGCFFPVIVCPSHTRARCTPTVSNCHDDRFRTDSCAHAITSFL